MMYPYIILSDETEIVHSDILEEDGIKKIEVHFERPTENGFDMARCQLPCYKWIKKEGFTDDDIVKFEQLLHKDESLLYRHAEDKMKK